jgi:hypothetical protein
MVTCPTCGATNADESTFCSTCGGALGPASVGGGARNLDAAADDLDAAAGIMSRTAYLARAMQTAAVAIVGVHLLKLILGVFRGGTSHPPLDAAGKATLTGLEKVAVGMAEQTDAAFLIALILALGLALLPWFLDDELPWPALRKTPVVLGGSGFLAVVTAIVATLNVRANLVVQKTADAAFKYRLAAYLAQALGLAVIIVVISATGFAMTRPRPGDFDEPILPDDAHGHEHDHPHGHDHAH